MTAGAFVNACLTRHTGRWCYCVCFSTSHVHGRRNFCLYVSNTHQHCRRCVCSESCFLFWLHTHAFIGTASPAASLVHRWSYIVLVSVAHSAVLDHRTMGSYEERLLECSWCRRLGMDSPAGHRPHWVPGLTYIVDFGVLCDPCLHTWWPPHAEYLQRLLPVTRTSSELIVAYAYPLYAEAIVDAAYPAGVVEGG